MSNEIETKLAELAGEMKKKTDEVTELGKKLLADNEAGLKSSEEVKAKLDQALTEQGELKQRMLEIEQAVTKGLQNIADAGQPEDVLGEALRKAYATDELKRAVTDPSFARGKAFNIALDRKALVNTGVTGAALNYPGAQVLAQPLQPLLRRLTVRDLLMPGRTNKSVIFYQRETGFTNNAAPVSEGSLKPKSEITFELVTEPVRTIAHLLDISLQMLDDVEFIQSYVQNRMTYELKLIEEGQLLTGSGTGQNLEGIYTAATPYSQPAGAEVVNEQDLDKLRLALLQVELAEAFTTGIVLHPTSWANIELLKDGENRYLFTNPQNTTTGRIWGRDVVSTQAMALGTFLVGDFAMHAQIFDRQDANLAISFENKDNFERNMATLRLEERLALAIYRPEAFVRGTLESAS
jgi:HK97 family phage major capsid protein